MIWKKILQTKKPTKTSYKKCTQIKRTCFADVSVFILKQTLGLYLKYFFILNALANL